MKSLIVGFAILLHLTATAQSPGLTINVIMDSAKTHFTRYKIQMKMGEPKKMTEWKDWFSHDTSAIDFASLEPDDITCGEYFDKGTPVLISGQDEEPLVNRFEFSNQVFAWEKIFVFKISNMSSRAWWPEMYIVIPMKYKSFDTQIDITGIEFQSGKVIFLTHANAFYDKKKLNIRQSLKNEKGVEVKDFPLKELLEKNNLCGLNEMLIQ